MRKLKSKEVEIIEKLLQIAGRKVNISELLVSPLNDSGMGSLAIGENYGGRQLGQEIAEYMFKDLDGTPISASLNVDLQGDLYELDIWKVDFSPSQVLK